MIGLIQLFIAFFQIGLFTIGGGIASLPLIETIIVNKHAWISYEQFSHLVVISEMTPGPIAVNASTFVGNQLYGFTGGLVATLGVVLTSFIIVIIFAKVYFKYRKLQTVNSVLNGLRPTVVGLVAYATLTITLTALFNTNSIVFSEMSFDMRKIVLLIFYVVILRKYKPNPILIIVLSGVLGYIFL